MFDVRPDIMHKRTYRFSTKPLNSELFPWVELVSDAVVVLDRHEHVVFVNTVAKRIFVENKYDRNIVIPSLTDLSKGEACVFESVNGIKYLSCKYFEKDGFHFIVVKDYTSENKLKGVIQKQQNFFERLLSNLPFGFLHCKFISKNRIEILGINNTFKKHLGIEMSESTPNIALKLDRKDENYLEIIEDVSSGKGSNNSFVKQINKSTYIYYRAFKAGENEVVCLTEDISQQVLNEKERKISQQRLMLAQRSTSDGLFDFNVETKDFYLSPRFYAMLEYQENVFEPTIENWVELVHPDDFEHIVQPLLKESMEGSDFFRAELRMKTDADEWKWLLVRGQVVKRNSDKKPLRIVGTHQDISLLKEQTRIAKEHGNQLNRLINNVDGIVYRCKYDENWTMLYLNAGVEKVTGYLPRQLVNNKEVKFSDVIHPEDKQRVWDEVVAYANTSDVFDIVYRILTSDGETKWVHERGAFVFSNNKVSHVEGIIVDITDQKRMEDALKQSERKFRTYIANAPDGVVVLNYKNQILEANKVAVQLTQFSNEELIQKDFGDLIHGDQSGLRMFYRLMNEIGHASCEVRLRSAKSKIFYAVLSGAKLPNRKRLIFVKDINARKNTEIQLQQKNEAYQKLNQDYASQNEKLTSINEEFRRMNSELRIAKNKAEESEQLKSAFLANMSHEIRTPMNGILGFSRLMINPGLLPEKKERYISVIEKSGDQLLGIINNILDISKIETRQVNLSISSFSVKSFMEGIYIRFVPDAKEKGLKLQSSFQSMDMEIETDKVRFEQIITNLLTNALKFTTKGYVKLGYKTLEDQLLVFVEDTGPGISKENQQKIFERFHQVDTGVFQSRGTGLGLAITKGLVEILGGTIAVESQPGNGARFKITLPLKSLQ
jgi:PAS domain S-box-containing protein